MKVRVKVCGITRSEDALLAARLRVDALGFNFWPKSRRYVSPEAAAPIVRALPPGVLPVGVFVNPTRDEVLRATEVAGIRSIQLHGDEPPDFCASLPIPVVKGIRVTDSHSLAALASYEVAGFLLDSATSGYGGSGTPFDWSVAAEAASVVPIWLAGGLTPENVAEAVRLVRPHGVDVVSGVESAPGVKSAERMEAFIRAAKEASG